MKLPAKARKVRVFVDSMDLDLLLWQSKGERGLEWECVCVVVLGGNLDYVCVMGSVSVVSRQPVMLASVAYMIVGALMVVHGGEE